jgi:branched-subunit amino acid transport protein
VAVSNSIKLGPLVFLLYEYIFVITENIMKLPVLFDGFTTYVQLRDLSAIYKDKVHWTVLINKKV